MSPHSAVHIQGKSKKEKNILKLYTNYNKKWRSSRQQNTSLVERHEPF
jgi:hypothetical protein